MRKKVFIFKKRNVQVVGFVLSLTLLCLFAAHSFSQKKQPIAVALSPEIVGEGVAVSACVDSNYPTGNVDAFSCDYFAGWSVDWHQPSVSINIGLHKVENGGDVWVTDQPANQPRSDVNAAFGIGGDHGWSFGVPRSLIDGQWHLLRFMSITSVDGYPTIYANWDRNLGDIGFQCGIPAPTNPSHVCAANGASFTASWTAPAGWNSFYWRLHDNTTNTDLYDNNTLYATSKRVTITPGHTYSWWVHTRNEAIQLPNPDWSGSIGESLTCPLGAPTSMNYTCAANGASVTFTWPAVTGATVYYPRYWSPSGVCSSGWTLYTDGHTCYIDAYAGTQVVATITPGTTYDNAWVHAGLPIGAPVGTGAFTCNATPGTISLCAGGVCGNPATQTNVAHTLAWSCPSGYTTSAGVGFSTGGALSGSVTVTPANTTTYEIHCNPGNTVTSITATVVTPQLSLAAQAPRVYAGQSASLTWSASDVTSCALTAPNGTSLASVTATGGVISSRTTATGAVPGKSTYTLTCQTVVGPRSVSVDVGLIPKVIEI